MTSAAYYVAGGCAIVLFVEAISVPVPVKVLVAEIAGASLFIYLTHYVMISVVRKVFGVEKPWVALISSIVVGVVIARLYAWMARKFVLTVDKLRRGDGTANQPLSTS